MSSQPLLHPSFRVQLEHGGGLRLQRRKIARPIATKKPMHVVLRSTKARSRLSLLHPENAMTVKRTVGEVSRRWNVRVYQWANSGNHIHLLVRAKSRDGFRGFLRSLAGTIALRVTGARKGKPFGRFWDLLAYSRIVEWGKAFLAAKIYVLQNHLGAIGVIKYRPRRSKSIRI